MEPQTYPTNQTINDSNKIALPEAIGAAVVVGGVLGYAGFKLFDHFFGKTVGYVAGTVWGGVGAVGTLNYVIDNN